MTNTIAIRREDLSKTGEKRTAIDPSLAQKIISLGHPLLVQPANHPLTREEKRVFPDQVYEQKGAIIRENLEEADVIFGLKEVEIEQILPQKAYYMFSHTHKGQVKNRKMLKTLVDQQCTLIDYELIVNAKKQRLITAFTYFAGYAGMVDSLWALGKRWAVKGISNPLTAIPQSIEKEDLDLIKSIVKSVGQQIAEQGTPAELPPLICCFLGAGKTSTGAQSIFQLLKPQSVSLSELPDIFRNGSRHQVYQLVLDIPEMYRLKPDNPYKGQALSFQDLFDLYLREPTHFESNMDQVFPYCKLLMNCIIWSPEYPRLLSLEDTARWYAAHSHPAVIGDITCDPEGAIQFSKETWIDDPVFIYDPISKSSQMGFSGEGIAVMAVTNLPCEFPADASKAFSRDLNPFIKQIIRADYQAESAEKSGLPEEILAATILWKGRFTSAYAYMQTYQEA